MIDQLLHDATSGSTDPDKAREFFWRSNPDLALICDFADLEPYKTLEMGTGRMTDSKANATHESHTEIVPLDWRVRACAGTPDNRRAALQPRAIPAALSDY